jgi:hypothetical protein
MLYLFDYIDITILQNDEFDGTEMFLLLLNYTAEFLQKG